MINIIKIEWLSIESKEAEIHLSDGRFNIKVFSQPFEEQKKIILPIYSMNTRNIQLSSNEFFIKNYDANSFEYNISGCIIDRNKGLVKLGDFLIQTDEPFPKDIEEGDFISFQCDRLDIW